MAKISDTFGVVTQIAVRNLAASRLKTFIVGGIILFGALLVVVGTSLLDSIDQSMARSVTGSVAGHIQVYSSRSKDELEVLGSFNMDAADLDPLDDFTKVRDTLLKLPNVKAVVPMGLSGALVTSGNTIDVALEKLRNAVRERLAGNNSPELQTRIDSEKSHIRQIVTVLEGDLANVRKLQDARALSAEEEADVKRAAAPAFWNDFDKAPLDALEFLENRIAPRATDADMLFLRYMGTDPDAFSRSFDRMKIVDGTAIPRGKRGFLFAKYTYEEFLKLKTARRLDKIREAMQNRGVKIASDPELQRFVRENSLQVKELLLQLDGPKTTQFRTVLQKEVESTENDVGKLLTEFFKTTDDNFLHRYDFFYQELAPALELYRIRVGDTLTIKAFTRTGYVQSVNLRVYGTFDFKGLEKSTLTGQINLMDMVSFRQLYGFLTADRQKEILALKASSGAKDVARENAEAELFGSKAVDTEEVKPTGRVVEATATPGLNPPTADSGIAGKLRREDLVDRVFDPNQLESGVVLNAAVILKDPNKMKESMADIEAAGAKVGLPLKAISWQKAAGLIGQFVTMMRMVLYATVLIIFVVALVIINNSMVMATLERVQEIGTLRALGAQKRFILGMLVVESIVVAVLFGGLGLALGGALIGILGRVGIPAPNDIFAFFFSGPRLYPALGTASLGTALVIVLLVSVVSSFYPAWLAMRVTPRQAMQSEE